MKTRTRTTSLGLGLLMILGSTFMLPTPAHAAPGDLYFNGYLTIDSLGPVPISGTGYGAVSGSSWTGSLNGSGILGGCMLFNLVADRDVINWGGSPTQTLEADIKITIDSSNCSFPPLEICILKLKTNKVLTASSFLLSGGSRSGTFSLSTTVGTNTIDPYTSGSCPTGSGTLFEVIDTAVGGRTGTSDLVMTFFKELEL